MGGEGSNTGLGGESLLVSAGFSKYSRNKKRFNASTQKFIPVYISFWECIPGPGEKSP